MKYIGWNICFSMRSRGSLTRFSWVVVVFFLMENPLYKNDSWIIDNNVLMVWTKECYQYPVELVERCSNVSDEILGISPVHSFLPNMEQNLLVNGGIIMFHKKWDKRIPLWPVLKQKRSLPAFQKKNYGFYSLPQGSVCKEKNSR